MLNKETVNTLYKRAENILANLSYEDFWKVNKNSPRVKKGKFTPSGKERKWLPYSLSEETLECKEIIQLILSDNITREQEEKIKGFILKYRLLKPEYLESKN